MGRVTIDGAAVDKTKMGDLAQKVGLLFQNPENQIFMFSVERDVAFGLENLGLPREEMRTRVDEAMRLLGISDLWPSGRRTSSRTGRSRGWPSPG